MVDGQRSSSDGDALAKNQDEAFRSWEKLLNPEILRKNLIASSLFLSGYEILRSSIIDHIRDFFCDNFSLGEPSTSKEYQEACLSLDKSPLRASLLWLKQMDIVNDEDLEFVDKLRSHRNEIAHKLPRVLETHHADVNIQLLQGIYLLVSKIDRWWIREVEMSVNPDFDNVEVAEEEITSGNMILIQVMHSVAMEEDSGTLWKEFRDYYNKHKA